MLDMQVPRGSLDGALLVLGVGVTVAALVAGPVPPVLSVFVIAFPAIAVTRHRALLGQVLLAVGLCLVLMLPVTGWAPGQRWAVSGLAIITWLALAGPVGRLREDAQRDPLTLAMNRRAFDGALLQIANRGSALNGPAWLVLLDIDGLKLRNDQYGHADGDRLLQQVVQMLRTTVRQSDPIGRLGGDEFGLLLADVNETRTDAIIAMLQRRLAIECDVTASFGKAEYQLGLNIAEWIARADAALYEAKRARYNGIREPAVQNATAK